MANALAGREGDGDAGGEREARELVFALCHEIGNLLGAIRLHAHLIDEEMSARDLAFASLELDDLSARASLLLTQLRPLLSERPRRLETLSAPVLVASLEQTLREQGGRGAAIHFQVEPELAPARGDQSVISSLLQSLIFAALEAAGTSGSVALRAERRPGAVAFVVEDDGEVVEDPTRWREQMRRGRTLLCAVADQLLGKLGGRLEVDRVGGRTRIGLILPAS